MNDTLSLADRSPQSDGPSFTRILSAAAGIEPWSRNEAAQRDRSPQRLVAEAQAQLLFARTAGDSQSRTTALRAAVDLICKLPSEELRSSARDLLATYLDDELRREFMMLCASAGGFTFVIGRLMFGMLVAAASIIAVITIRTSYIPTSPALSATVIAASGTINDARSWRNAVQAITASDEFDYSATVRTTLPQAWLVHLREDSSEHGRDFVELFAGKNENGVIQFKQRLPRAAIDGFERFLVIVPDRELRLDAPEYRELLTRWNDDLFLSDDTIEEKSELVRKQLQRLGYAGSVKIHADEYVRRRENR